ncbi:MAG: C1 family peptidase [Bacteroidales bacterium]|nr:C1 family peptidase [Bacteroidales bacterium]
MLRLLKLIIPGLLVLVFSFQVKAQSEKDSLPEKFIFTKIIDLPATPVKDQSASGTCWSYATASFIESELLRITKDTFDLSEMFFARKAYEAKATHYVRLHGTANFGEGGQAHDVMNAVRKYGMIPEAAYSGLANGQTKPVHAEMDAVLKAMVEAISKNPAGKLSPEWINAISGVLDVYLGKVPATFGSANTTPLEFAKKINPDDYIEITSYTHHPYYSTFSLEVPDNWTGNAYYNVPLDDLIQIMDFALNKGYTIAWDGDVSDKGFSHKNGIAIVPEVNIDNIGTTERSKWEKLTEKERKVQFYTFTKPVPERNITSEIRQAAFDNFSATDDHLMHITGTVTDQNGKRYFRTKNSWSAESNTEGGYVNISEAYIRLNTIAIMVHKDSVPNEIRKKLGFK